MQITLKVPVKGYVKSFLVREFGSELIVLKSQRQNPIFNKLYDLLCRPNRYHPYSLDASYSEYVRFDLGSETVHRAGFDLRDEKVIGLNKFIDHLIRERLYILLDSAQQIKGFKIKAWIEDYMEHNDLTESFTYEQLKKSYYRYRQNKGQRVECWEVWLMKGGRNYLPSLAARLPVVRDPGGQGRAGLPTGQPGAVPRRDRAAGERGVLKYTPRAS